MGYNIFVKKKEKELRQLIEEVAAQNQDQEFKDNKIKTLETVLRDLREDQVD